MYYQSTRFDTLKQILYSLIEKYHYTLALYFYCIKIKLTLNNKNVIDKLKTEIEQLIEMINTEIKILKFALINDKKLYLDTIYNIIDEFDQNYNNRIEHIQYLFSNINFACEEHLISRATLFGKTPIAKTYQEYLTYLKGFSYDQIKSFFKEEDIASEEEINNLLKDAPYTEKINCISLQESSTLPIVSNETTTYIAIYKLVQQVLSNKKESINNDFIVKGNDLPIFYQLLFHQNNHFTENTPQSTPLALKLLNDYNDEPFSAQIEKLKIFTKNIF